MAVALVASSRSGASDASGTSCVVPVPAGAASGLIALLGMKHWETFDASSIVWPSGFAVIPTVNGILTGNRQKLYVAWKRLTGADTGNYTVTWTSSQWSQGHCILISGALASGDPIETTNTASGTGTAIPSTSVTIATLAFLAHFVDSENSASETTPPSSFTKILDGDYLRVNYRIPGATGAFSAASGVLSASTAKNAALIAVKPDTGGGANQGTMAGSLPKPRGPLTGQLVNRGTVAGTNRRPTGNLTATAKDQGTAAGSLPRPAGSLSGTAEETGSIAGTLPRPGGSLAATAKTAGTLGGSVRRPIGNVTATAIDRGALAGSLPKPVGNLVQGAQPISGVLVGNLTKPVGSIAGSVRSSAVVAGSLPRSTGALTGQIRAVGSIAGTVPRPTGSLVGSSTALGQLQGTVPALVGSLHSTPDRTAPPDVVAGGGVPAPFAVSKPVSAVPFLVE